MRLTHLRPSNFVLPIIIFLTLTACTAERPSPTLATLVETPSATPTATIQWFPSTSTAAPQIINIATATPVPMLGIGKIIVSDNFNSPSMWNTVQSGEGSVSVSRKRITIAVKEPQSYIFSLRNEPMLGDFYAEIDAHPALCKGDDSYGLVFRSNGKTAYRYALACNGTVRLELRKIYNSPRVLKEPFGSGDAPRGSPGDVRLGVWVAGEEMRFYLNDRYQFTVVDTRLKEAGSIGVFAETAPENSAMTVTFSDLVVQSVGYVSPTPTPTVTKTPVPTSTKVP